jgi:hypothetical protein
VFKKKDSQEPSQNLMLCLCLYEVLGRFVPRNHEGVDRGRRGRDVADSHQAIGKEESKDLRGGLDDRG